jgi:hypothetical protein
VTASGVGPVEPDAGLRVLPFVGLGIVGEGGRPDCGDGRIRRACNCLQGVDREGAILATVVWFVPVLVEASVWTATASAPFLATTLVTPLTPVAQGVGSPRPESRSLPWLTGHD